MKKGIVSVLLLLCMITLVTGCNSNKVKDLTGGSKEKITKCSLYKKDVTSNYEINSTYTVYSKNKIAYKVETIEKVTSDSAEVLNSFETSLNNSYSQLNNAYGGYKYEITKKNNELVSNVLIDYSKVNLEQLANDQPTMKNVMDDNYNILLDGLLGTYKSIGATCE